MCAAVSTRKKREFPKMDEPGVVEALRTRHPKDQWCFMPGFANHVGFNGTRTYDVMCIGLWQKHGYERRVYEVKVSRSDFAHEVNNPQKRESALKNSNTFYFAVPWGMVDKEEVPEECGLVYVRPNGETRTVKTPEFRKFDEQEKVNFGIFMSMANRASDAENQNRLYQAMKWRIDKHEQNHIARKMLYHLRQLVEKALDDLAHPTCVTCAGLPENYTPNEEQLAAYAAQGHHKGLWGDHKHHSALRERRWTLDYHRLAIKRIAYKFLKLDLPEHEVEPDYQAEAKKQRDARKEEKREAKALRDRMLADWREKEKLNPSWVQDKD